MSSSPFSLNRFELEQAHLYFLPKRVFSILEAKKSVFLLGSRGTGKTTLMKALNWNEQITNPSLIKALNSAAVDRRYIGLYLKLTLSALTRFRVWPVGDDAVRAAVFSAYIDLLWLEPLLEALAHLAARRILRSKPAREYDACAAVLRKFPELGRLETQSSQPSFTSLAKLVEGRRIELERLALAKSDISIEKLAERYPLGQVGTLGRSAATILTEYCSASTQQQPWHVKVCMDEAECLDTFQQRVMNTAVRLTHASLSYVISYVGRMEDPTGTVLPNLSLQRADREIVALDSSQPDQEGFVNFLDDDMFRELAEGVCKARISAFSSKAAETFSTVALLGKLDINHLLWNILNSSESAEAARLLAIASQLRDVYDDVGGAKDRRDGDAPPIYQAYIIDRLGLEKPTAQTPKERRSQDSAELRKRMVAAYLCICAELGKRVRYAYGEMVFQMCDKCVRDYLWQMDEMYRESGVFIDDFCNSVVPVERQDIALRRAAKNKCEYVPVSGISTPIVTLRLIDALSTLTARLQATTHEQRGLRSSERGLFVLDAATGSPTALENLKIIAEAADAGFLKVVEQRPDQWVFRVHCSLAAAYGFSYRGAYYPVEIRHVDLSSLIAESDSDRRSSLLGRIEAWMGTNASGDLPLFPEVAM